MAKDNHDIVKICAYCERAKCLCDEFTMLCKYKGVVDAEYSCRHFVYDPLKRSPTPTPKIPTLSRDDII